MFFSRARTSVAGRLCAVDWAPHFFYAEATAEASEAAGHAIFRDAGGHDVVRHLGRDLMNVLWVHFRANPAGQDSPCVDNGVAHVAGITDALHRWCALPQAAEMMFLRYFSEFILPRLVLEPELSIGQQRWPR